MGYGVVNKLLAVFKQEGAYLFVLGRSGPKGGFDIFFDVACGSDKSGEGVIELFGAGNAAVAAGGGGIYNCCVGGFEFVEFGEEAGEADVGLVGSVGGGGGEEGDEP